MEEHVPARSSSSHGPPQKKRRQGVYARVAALLRRPLRGQRGQAIIEYMLVLIIALTFTQQVFFNKTWGFRGVLEKTMLRLGSFLEQNLKSGTKVGGDGRKSLDPFAGTDRWSN